MMVNICNKCRCTCDGYFRLNVSKIYADKSMSFITNDVDLCPNCYDKFNKFLEDANETTNKTSDI